MKQLALELHLSPIHNGQRCFFTQQTKVFLHEGQRCVLYTTDIFYTTDKGSFFTQRTKVFFYMRDKGVFLHDGQRCFFYTKDKGDGDASTIVHIQHYNHIVFYLHSLQVQMAAQITSRTVQSWIPIDQP